MPPVILVEHLVKEFKLGFWRNKLVRVLSDVSFQVEPNHVFGLLGPNGAGKTTTLKALLGLIRPTAGRLEVLGKSSQDIEVKRRLGFLPENPYFYSYLSGEEFLHLCADIFSLPAATRRARTKALLEKVGLASAARKPLGQYSKGMLQRVGIAQALINDPEVVFLDEPTTGLDPIGRREVRLLVQELKQEGKTVFFNSHILSDVEQICDDVGIMVKGRIRLAGAVDAVMAEGARGVKLEARQVPPELAARLGADAIEARGDRGAWYGLFKDQAAALAAAQAVAAAGGVVAALAEARRSLEDVFMATIHEVERTEGEALRR